MISAIVLTAALVSQTAPPPDEDWRAPDPENLIYIEVSQSPAGDAMEALLGERKTGLIVVELYPELAPLHAEQIKALTRQGFYDRRVFHRVIDGFMSQAGGLPGDPSGGASPLPDIQAEFTARLGPQVQITQVEEGRLVNERFTGMGRSLAGLYKGAHVGYQPAAQAFVSADGKRDVWMIHCRGAASMARPQNEDGANFQFYLMRGDSPWLDAQYTAWGRVVYGQDWVESITPGEPPARPDRIESMRVGADIPQDEQIEIEILSASSDWYQDWIDNNPGAGVCDAPIQTRMKEG